MWIIDLRRYGGSCRNGEIRVFFEQEPTNPHDTSTNKYDICWEVDSIWGHVLLTWFGGCSVLAGRSRELRLLGYIARTQALNWALRECVRMAQFPKPLLFMSGIIRIADLVLSLNGCFCVCLFSPTLEYCRGLTAMQEASAVNPHTVPRDPTVRHVPISVKVWLHHAHPDCDEEIMRAVYMRPLEDLQDFVHLLH